MSSVIEHCDAQCQKCPINCHGASAMDDMAEWAARSHPLPHPQPSHLRVVREPLPSQPFAPGVIERHERRKSARLLLLIVAASACLVIGVAVGVLR